MADLSARGGDKGGKGGVDPNRGLGDRLAVPSLREAVALVDVEDRGGLGKRDDLLVVAFAL